jgi:hypothetical protein
MDYRAQLVTLVEVYSKAINRSEATVANSSGRDSQFFVRMRAGKGCGVDTMLGTLQWFSDHWPADTAWPDGVIRPEPATAEPGKAA